MHSSPHTSKQTHLITDHLHEMIIPVLFEVMELRLKREIDLGSFKHECDDALPLRKAALACIGTILNNVPELMQIGNFMPYLVKGLRDLEEVQILCHQVVTKITTIAPGAIIGSVEDLVAALVSGDYSFISFFVFVWSYCKGLCTAHRMFDTSVSSIHQNLTHSSPFT